MEGAGQASQQEGTAELLIEFYLSMGTDWQWTAPVPVQIKLELVTLVITVNVRCQGFPRTDRKIWATFFSTFGPLSPATACQAERPVF